MTGPVSIDTTVRGMALRQKLVNSHTLPTDLVWVTTRAWSSSDTWRDRVGRWAELSDLLRRPAGANPRIRLELPEATPGARGHITVAKTRWDLLCLNVADARADEPWPAVSVYRCVDPAWIHDQPAHIRRLLFAIRCCRAAPVPAPPTRRQRLLRKVAPLLQPPAAEPRGLYDFTTTELARTLDPFLDVPAYMADTLAAAASAYPDDQPLDLAELLDIAHAF